MQYSWHDLYFYYMTFCLRQRLLWDTLKNYNRLCATLFYMRILNIKAWSDAYVENNELWFMIQLNINIISSFIIYITTIGKKTLEMYNIFSVFILVTNFYFFYHTSTNVNVVVVVLKWALNIKSWINDLWRVSNAFRKSTNTSDAVMIVTLQVSIAQLSAITCSVV